MTTVSDVTNTQLLTGIQTILICLSFFALIVFITTVKKIWYRIKYKKRYYIFPKISVHGITNIAMVISISIAIILILTIVSAGLMAVLFRAYPGWRMSIEGILIKIGGLLFGPIIGVFVGITTDLLAIALTAGSFHYGYFIVAMMYGLIGGMINLLWKFSKENQVTFTGIMSVVWVLVFTAITLYILNQPLDVFRLQFFGIKLNLPKYVLVLIVSSIYMIGLFVVWTCMLSYNFYDVKLLLKKFTIWYKYKIPLKYQLHRYSDKNNKQKFYEWHAKWYSEHSIELQRKLEEVKGLKNKIKLQKKSKWFSYFVQTIGLVIMTDSLVEVMLLPVFDEALGAGLKYEYWLAFRTLNLMWLTPLNMIIIYPVYRIVCPSMKYKYSNDIVEDLNIPLIIE